VNFDPRHNSMTSWEAPMPGQWQVTVDSGVPSWDRSLLKEDSEVSEQGQNAETVRPFSLASTARNIDWEEEIYEAFKPEVKVAGWQQAAERYLPRNKFMPSGIDGDEELEKIKGLLQQKDVFFTFLGSEEEGLEASSGWLATCSDVFQAQFFGGLKQRIIQVEDFSRESFKFFLDVLNGEEIPCSLMKFSNWLDLLCLADKYLVAGLEDFLLEQMVSSLRKKIRLDPLLEKIFHFADKQSAGWKVCEKLLFHYTWHSSSEFSYDQWRTQIAIGCVECTTSGEIQPLLFQALDGVQQLLDLITRKNGVAEDVDSEAENIFQNIVDIVQDAESLTESLEMHML